VAERTPNCKSEEASIGINEAWEIIPKATVAMDHRKMRLAHFPRLLHDVCEHPISNDIGRVIPVEVNLHFVSFDDQRSI
jgi:hypothetical protein